MIYRLAYISTNMQPREKRDELLMEILSIARESNAASGVTGALICTDDAFFQTLEGDETDVRATYDRIAQDPRHTHVLKLLEETAETRAFPDWSMGHRDLSSEHPLARDIHRVKSALDVPGLTGSRLYLQATMFLAQ